MIYYSVFDFSSLTDGQTDFLRRNICKYFSDEKTLKRKESVAVKALLCRMLAECFGLTDFTVSCDLHGKPYIENSNLHFNLSHSGNYALCVCADEAVGCDIEKIKECNLKVAQRFFSKSEFAVLKNSDNTAHVFTKMWTLKESALKFSGKGISGGLDCYDFSEYYKEDKFRMMNLHFFSFEKDGYSVSICSEGDALTRYNTDIGEIKTDS